MSTSLVKRGFIALFVVLVMVVFQTTNVFHQLECETSKKLLYSLNLSCEPSLNLLSVSAKEHESERIHSVNNDTLEPLEGDKKYSPDPRTCQYRHERIKTKRPIHIAVISKPQGRDKEMHVALNSLLYFRTCPIHLHIISDFVGRRETQAFFDSQHPDVQELTISFYNLTELEQRVHTDDIMPYLPAASSSRYPGTFVKASLESVLPSSVDNIVQMDFDTIFLDDICKMNEEVFDQMNSKQFIAASYDGQGKFSQKRHRENVCVLEGLGYGDTGLEQSQLKPDIFAQKVALDELRDTKYECNAGFVALKLERMRKYSFTSKWKNEVISRNMTVKYDQYILNLMAWKDPNILYPLPLTYNLQMHWAFKHALQLYENAHVHMIHGTAQHFQRGGGCFIRFLFYSFRQDEKRNLKYHKTQPPENLVGRECQVRNEIAKYSEAKREGRVHQMEGFLEYMFTKCKLETEDINPRTASSK